MTKHFSKWLKLVPLVDYINEGIDYAFLNMVFNRFGVLVQVFIDQGINLYWQFQELCEKH
jgi:hypothetical protein